MLTIPPLPPYLQPLTMTCTRKMALEEEAAKSRERQEQQSGEMKPDVEAVELGDAKLCLPGSSGDTTLPE